jgi:hypothetical protein
MIPSLILGWILVVHVLVSVFFARAVGPRRIRFASSLSPAQAIAQLRSLGHERRPAPHVFEWMKVRRASPEHVELARCTPSIRNSPWVWFDGHFVEGEGMSALVGGFCVPLRVQMWIALPLGLFSAVLVGFALAMLLGARAVSWNELGFAAMLNAGTVVPFMVRFCMAREDAAWLTRTIRGALGDG